jgi:hypothetical protein
VPTLQENIDLTQREQLQYQQKADQDLLVRLNCDLGDLKHKESAANEILTLTKDSPGNAGDNQRASRALVKIAEQRALLQRRIEGTQWRIEAAQIRLKRFDHPALNRAKNLQHLVSQLAGIAGIAGK